MWSFSKSICIHQKWQYFQYHVKQIFKCRFSHNWNLLVRLILLSHKYNGHTELISKYFYWIQYEPYIYQNAHEVYITALREWWSSVLCVVLDVQTFQIEKVECSSNKDTLAYVSSSSKLSKSALLQSTSHFLYQSSFFVFSFRNVSSTIRCFIFPDLVDKTSRLKNATAKQLDLE